jgi:PAS domain S-box-containing protein
MLRKNQHNSSSLATLNLRTGRILALFLAIFLLIIRFTQPERDPPDLIGIILAYTAILYCLSIFTLSYLYSEVKKRINELVLISFFLIALGFFHSIYLSNFKPITTSGLFIFSILTAFFMLSLEYLAVYQLFMVAFLLLTYFLLPDPPNTASIFMIRFPVIHLVVFLIFGSRIRYIEKLEAANQEKDLMIQKLNCGVFQIDKEGQFTLANQMFFHMTDYSENEISEKIPFPELVLDEDRGTIDKILENSLQGISDKFEARLVKKDGKPFWVFGTVTPRYDDKNAIVGTTFILADITRKKEIADEYIEQLQDQELTIKGLNQKNEELQKFLQWASIELRVVYESLRQSIGTLSPDEVPDEENVPALRKKIKQLDDIIDRFQFYSLASYVKPNYEKINSEEIVEEIKQALAEDITLNRAQISYTDLPVIEADRTQFHRLMSNLIENGLRYRGPSSPEITISCTENLSKDEYVFAIEDNGIGINKNDYDKIFRLFEQNREEERGTLGLGLTICKKIVLNHQGRLWFTSNYGKGSTFFFSIPRHKPSVPPGPTMSQING